MPEIIGVRRSRDGPNSSPRRVETVTKLGKHSASWNERIFRLVRGSTEITRPHWDTARQSARPSSSTTSLFMARHHLLWPMGTKLPRLVLHCHARTDNGQRLRISGSDLGCRHLRVANGRCSGSNGRSPKREPRRLPLRCCRWPCGPGCNPNRHIGRGATRLQVSGTARTSRVPLTGLRRIGGVRQSHRLVVGPGSTGMSAVRAGELTLSTQSGHRPRRIGRPEADVRIVEQRTACFPGTNEGSPIE